MSPLDDLDLDELERHLADRLVTAITAADAETAELVARRRRIDDELQTIAEQRRDLVARVVSLGHEAPSPPDGAPNLGDLLCPECGRRFTTKQGLGRHRTSTHGVPGSSHAAQHRRKQKTAAAPTPPAKPTPPPGPSAAAIAGDAALAGAATGRNAPRYGCDHCDVELGSRADLARHRLVEHPDADAEDDAA